MAAKLKIEKRDMKLKKIFPSETTEPISTKLTKNDGISSHGLKAR
jgi:hypothetical protein